MIIEQLLLSLVVLLGAAVLLRPLAHWTRLPFSLLLILGGFLGAELLVRQGLDTGVRAGNYHDLVFYLLLPILVFESAHQMDCRELLRNLGVILLLAVPGMICAALITAALVYYGIGHPSGFPWLAALITGALLSATDPVAVINQMRSLGAPKRLEMLLEGESLFNDATAIVLFTIFVALAGEGVGGGVEMGESAAAFSFWSGLLDFGRVSLMGAACGLGCAALGLACTRWAPGAHEYQLITVVVAFGSFLLAEHWHVSGIMAVLCAGIVFSLARDRIASRTQEESHSLWEVLGHVAVCLVFLLSGITVSLGMFQDRWLAMLIGIGAVLAARLVVVHAMLALARLGGAAPFPRGYRPVMVWGGLRGAVTLALALALPTHLPYWWTIQSIAFGVVLFTLVVAAPTTLPLLRRVPGEPPPEETAAK